MKFLFARKISMFHIENFWRDFQLERIDPIPLNFPSKHDSCVKVSIYRHLNVSRKSFKPQRSIVYRLNYDITEHNNKTNINMCVRKILFTFFR